MQEFIDNLKSIDIKVPNGVKLIFIEKEKEQIVNAYSDGAKGGANGTKGQHKNGWVSIQMKEKYYNQTYNQNEI